jgi:hypothetical protein
VLSIQKKRPARRAVMIILRIIKLFIFEIKQYFRSFAMIGLFVFPIILIFLFANFTLLSQEKVQNFVISKNTEISVIENFEKCGKVTIVENVSKIQNIIEKNDGYIGIDGNHIIVKKSDPVFLQNYAKLLLNYNQTTTKVNISDVGIKATIYKYSIVVFLINLCILVGGIVFGISILRERLNKTYFELKRYCKNFAFYFSKLIFPCVLIVCNIALIDYVFKLEIRLNGYFNAFVLLSLSLVILIGLIIGYVPKNQAGSFIVVLIILGIFLLTAMLIIFEKLEFMLYISSFYWSFLLLYNIINNNISNVLFYASLYLILNLCYILLIKKRLIDQT